jgi:calcineurin-like phosphoesterase family protein
LEIVYVLGDVAKDDDVSAIQIFNKLKGHKHLIVGNHDHLILEEIRKSNIYFFCIILFGFGRKTFVGSFLVEKFRQKSVMLLEGDSMEFYGREEEQKSIMPIQYFRL